MLEIIYHPCVKQISYNVKLLIRHGIVKENTVFNFNTMFKLAENDKIELYDVAFVLHDLYIHHGFESLNTLLLLNLTTNIYHMNKTWQCFLFR